VPGVRLEPGLVLCVVGMTVPPDACILLVLCYRFATEKDRPLVRSTLTSLAVLAPLDLFGEQPGFGRPHWVRTDRLRFFAALYDRPTGV
jgi:hypothetical protein